MLHDITASELDKNRIEAIYALKHLARHKESRLLEAVHTQQQIIKTLYYGKNAILDTDYNTLYDHCKVIDNSQIHIIKDNAFDDEPEAVQNRKHLRSPCECKRMLKVILKRSSSFTLDYDDYRISVLQ